MIILFLVEYHPKFLGGSDRDRKISSTVDQEITMRERNMVRVCLLVTAAMTGKGQQICHLLCSSTRPLENIIPVWVVQKFISFYRTRILTLRTLN